MKKRKIDKIVFINSISLLILFLIIFLLIERRKTNEFARNIIKKDMIEARGDFKKEYSTKCILARQVYQYQGFHRKKYKAGTLNIEKWYAMDVDKYSELTGMIFKFNAHLGLGRDEYFHILSQLIFESGISMDIEHKTGEIINLTGYTKSGFIHALHVYKYILRIEKSSPFYIKELYDRHPNFEIIFSDWRNVIKFHYAYWQWLLYTFDRRWDFALTAFNQGEGRVLGWKNIGLKNIPNGILSKKFNLRYSTYYSTILEISYATLSGYTSRISKYNKTVKKFRKYNKYRAAYIKTLQISFKKKEKTQEIIAKCEQLQKEVEEYKKINNELTQKINKLNDVNFDIMINKKTKFKKVQKKLIDEIIQLQKRVKELSESKPKRFKGFITFIGFSLIVIVLLITFIYILYSGTLDLYKNLKKWTGRKK